MTRMEYVVLLTQDEDGVLATVPDLPGVIAAGDTEEDAIARAREAIASHVEALSDSGWPVPQPRAKVVMIEAA